MKIYRTFCFCSLVLLMSYCSTYGNGDDKILFTVERITTPRRLNEQVQISIAWEELIRRFPAAKTKSIIVVDRNFGKTVDARFLDADKNGTPEALLFQYTFTSNDPIFTFSIHKRETSLTSVAHGAKQSEDIKVVFLSASKSMKSVSQKWSDRIIESTMTFYPDPLGIARYAPGEWNYEYGFFLSGVYQLGAQKNNEHYIQYVKKWADHFIDENGNLDTTQYRLTEYRLDDVLPGRLFLYLYDMTHDQKYRNAADKLIHHLKVTPRTSEGGYWHKRIYPYQMWLDGIYMGDVFSMQYAVQFDDPAWLDEAAHQIKLISKHTLDPQTGLMYHGWDESKNKTWAHPEKGTSPEFWGRAIGWYMMALADALEYIPSNHPERKAVEEIFRNLSASLLKYEDKQSHLWYQVLDKGAKPGNWIETSCSAMFGYAMAKGAHLGVLDGSYLTKATEVFDALIQDYVYVDDTGKLYFDQTVKVGTLNPKYSKGDFDYYISTERRINDYKGLASLLFLAKEIEYPKSTR
jgi:unsaturated rhamnogalacturonyl hydrolase